MRYEGPWRVLPPPEFSSSNTSTMTTEPLNIHGSCWVLQFFYRSWHCFPLERNNCWENKLSHDWKLLSDEPGCGLLLSDSCYGQGNCLFSSSLLINSKAVKKYWMLMLTSPNWLWLHFKFYLPSTGKQRRLSSSPSLCLFAFWFCNFLLESTGRYGRSMLLAFTHGKIQKLLNGLPFLCNV